MSKVDKYWLMLMDLHQKLKVDEKISMNDFRKEWKLSFSTISDLSKSGIIRKCGSDKHVRKYCWNVDKTPSMELAIELLNFGVSKERKKDFDKEVINDITKDLKKALALKKHHLFKDEDNEIVVGFLKKANNLLSDYIEKLEK